MLDIFRRKLRLSALVRMPRVALIKAKSLVSVVLGFGYWC
ncbi:hypothetical protein APS_1702 [Acetobacter pasteurianus subsp. pasteurianus LMG 1262 = NBRC 106471]|nr:hypothetical protein APS_1702 [Acetobacter pasteurianus subsp. pasteurianus LMG 1262 = NBRC 106471]